MIALRRPLLFTLWLAGLLVAGALLVQALAGAIGFAHGQDDVLAGPIDPPPAAAAPAAPAPIAPPAAAPTRARGGYSPDDWIKILAAVGMLIGSIGGLILTVQGNRARLAAELRAERAAELRAEQLRAVAASTGATVIAAPQPTVAGGPT